MTTPDIPTEALEADVQDPAFLAALQAVHNVDCPEGPGCREELGTWGRYGRYTRAAIDAARSHLIAEGRRQAAEAIRARSSEIAVRAESMAGAETGAADSHPFTLGCVWAAAIAEGTDRG